MLRPRLDPETLLTAYSQAAFPMADRDGSVRWYTADPRGVLPLDRFHVPKSLAQLHRNPKGFETRIDGDFVGTMRACRDGRSEGSWISDELIAAYHRLHELGFAHSVETWKDGELAGGLYGVALGGAFFGESMFTRVTNAGKLALVTLVHRLVDRGYVLLDAQATTEHLRRFGCVDVTAHEYRNLLDRALAKRCAFVDG